MNLLLTRRDAIASLGLAAAATMLPAFGSAQRGIFLLDPLLDQSGAVGKTMAARGWTLARINRRADALHQHLGIMADLPMALAGLTTDATHFMFAQIAQRRGMRRVHAIAPMWAYSAPGE